MKSVRWFVFLAVLAVVVAAPAAAQDKKEVQGYIAGGYVMPESKAADYFDGGWNISGGVIFRPIPDKPFGVRLDLGYSSVDASSSTLSLPDVPKLADDGYMSLGNLTAEVMWEFGSPDRFGGYVAIGGGGYRRYAALTADVLNTGYICDPYWGCYYASYIGTQTIADTSVIKWGWSAAAGATFGVGSGQLYVEARYHWMMTPPSSTQYFPILIGYRF